MAFIYLFAYICNYTITITLLIEEKEVMNFEEDRTWEKWEAGGK